MTASTTWAGHGSPSPQAAARRRGPGRRARPGRGRRATGLSRVACVVGVVGLWQALVATGVLPDSAVSAPTDVVRALAALVPTPGFWSSVGSTLRAWGIGLAVSLVIAVPVGLGLGASALAYRMTRVTIDFLRTIPPVAVIPLALLLYGSTERMVLLLVVFGSVWPVLLQSMYGVHDVDPVSLDVARSYRLRRRDVVLRVVLPSAAPFIATGTRISATISLLLVVGAELLGGAPGLGLSISSAEQAQQIPVMYAFVVTTAFLGLALGLVLMSVERRVLSWHAAHRPSAG